MHTQEIRLLSPPHERQTQEKAVDARSSSDARHLRALTAQRELLVPHRSVVPVPAALLLLSGRRWRCVLDAAARSGEGVSEGEEEEEGAAYGGGRVRVEHAVEEVVDLGRHRRSGGTHGVSEHGPTGGERLCLGGWLPSWEGAATVWSCGLRSAHVANCTETVPVDFRAAVAVSVPPATR